MRVNIGMVLRADGGWSVYGHVITKFSGMGRFTYPCGAAAVLRARKCSAMMVQFSVVLNRTVVSND